MQKQKPKIKNPKPIVPLLELLACNATGGARAILKKHGAEDANGYVDLQQKLADLYSRSKDKIEIEKEFAEIHPHKEFILKYLSPAPVETKVILPEPVSSAQGETELKKEGLTVSDKFLISTVAIVAVVGLVIHFKK